MQFDRMIRREFITLLGGTIMVLAPPLAVAQGSARTYRVALLTGQARAAPQILAFFDELRLLGFIEGQNLSVIPGGFDVPNDQLSQRAMEIIKAAPDAIFTPGGLQTRAAQMA